LGHHAELRSNTGRAGFTSYKTTEPVLFQRRWHRYALILLTLDPRVKIISPSADVLRHHFGAVTLEVGYNDEVRTCILLETEAVHPIHRQKSIQVIDRASVLIEPRLTNIKTIWSARGNEVDLATRFHLLDILADRVPIRLGDARLREMKLDRVFPALLKLASEGVLALDLQHPFGPMTEVQLTGFGLPDGYGNTPGVSGGQNRW
jgi:hypothetical protein